MAIVEAALVIHAPREVVYSISQDYSVRAEWDPFTAHLEMADGSPWFIKSGSRVFVRSKLGSSMVVEFVHLDPPSRAAVSMVSGPRYLRKFAGSWIFDEIDQRATLVRFRYLIAARRGMFRKAMDIIAAWYFQRVVIRRLEGLKRYCERMARLRATPPALRRFTL
jgi:hypothetical protein